MMVELMANFWLTHGGLLLNDVELMVNWSLIGGKMMVDAAE